MSAKAVSEYAGKDLLYRSLEHLPFLAKPHAVSLDENSDFASAIENCDWIKKEGVGTNEFFNCKVIISSKA